MHTIRATQATWSGQPHTDAPLVLVHDLPDNNNHQSPDSIVTINNYNNLHDYKRSKSLKVNQLTSPIDN